MIQRLFARLQRDMTVICECRRCGTLVDDASVACPACDHDGIATYRFR
jgi:rubrerythrin